MLRKTPTPPGANLFPADKTEFTTKEAAQYIGRKEVTIRKHMDAGNIEPCRTYGGRRDALWFLFSRLDLDRLYRNHCYHGKDR